MSKETPVKERRSASAGETTPCAEVRDECGARVGGYLLVGPHDLAARHLVAPGVALWSVGLVEGIHRPSELTFTTTPRFFPRDHTGGVLDSLVTSLEITIPATILVALISSLAAYSLVFGFWRGRDMIFLVIVGLMVVPLQVPSFPSFSSIGSWATSWAQSLRTIPGVIIFHVAFGLPFGIFLMRNFLSGIPKDLLEAGRIEGAGE